MAEDVAGALAVGVKPDQRHTDEVALRCEMLLDLERVEFSDISDFYKREPEKEG